MCLYTVYVYTIHSCIYYTHRGTCIYYTYSCICITICDYIKYNTHMRTNVYN